MALARLIRLPNTQLFLDYLALYPEYRKDDRNSPSNLLKYGYEYGLSFVTKTKPVADQLDEMVKEMEDEIIKAKDWTDWYQLIFILREKAEIAQSLKTKKGGESVLRETFHALADLIICELMECEFEQGTDDYIKYKNVFFYKVDTLQTTLKTIEGTESRTLHDNRGKGIEEVVKDEFKIVKELAYLCDLNEVNKARKYQLLNHFVLPTSKEKVEFKCSGIANGAAPLQLQVKYCEWVYAARFQMLDGLGISFSDFRRRSIEKVTLKLESDLASSKKEQEQARKEAEIEKLKLQTELEKTKKEVEEEKKRLAEELAKQKKQTEEEKKRIADELNLQKSKMLPHSGNDSLNKSTPLPALNKSPSSLQVLSTFASSPKIDEKNPANPILEATNDNKQTSINLVHN